MQDRYAGDIGDFGKFHLLRTLFLESFYDLKQIWYMYPNEEHNSDGQYINYFDKVNGCDTFLEETLQRIVKGKRTVQALEEAKLLPSCTFFGFFITNKGKDELNYRQKWLNDAVIFAKNADFIFVDPDNGLATKFDKASKGITILGLDAFKSKPKSGKYIFLDELQKFYEVGRCVVVYHHLNRTMSHNEQIEKIQQKLKDEFYEVFAIKHKPYSPRVYFFVLKDKEVTAFIQKGLTFFASNFNVHWELFL